MPQHPTPPPIVRVAVAAVVEKMSTVEQEHPASTQTPPWDGTTPEQLRVLITQRKPEQVLGGLWELPGGKIEPDESPKQAVIREIAEETGITITPLAELPPVEHTYDHATVTLLPMICQRTQGLPRPIEVADARWVALDELSNYTFPEASLPVIDALTAYLHQQTSNAAR